MDPKNAAKLAGGLLTGATLLGLTTVPASAADQADEVTVLDVQADRTGANEIVLTDADGTKVVLNNAVISVIMDNF